MLKILPAKLIFAILLLYTGFAVAGTDSLLNRWHTARQQPGYNTDTANVGLLIKIADNYRYNHTDSALYFAGQALQLAQKTKYLTGQAMAYFQIASANYIKGAYFPSLEAAAHLMNISQKIHYKPGIAKAYQTRGLIYLLQDDFDNAIIEFKKAYKVAEQIGNKKIMAYTLFDIGLCFDEKHMPDTAFIHLDKSIEIGSAIKDEHIIAMAYNRKGETFFRSKNYNQAISFYNKVLNGTYQDNWENGFALSGLAQAQHALGQYDKATVNALKSYEIARDMNSAWDAARALKILTQCYQATGDYKKAFEYQTLMNKYNESYLTDTKQKQINYLQLKQQRSENLRLQRENEIHTQKIDFNRLLMAGIIVLTVCISIFAVFISRSNVHKTLLNKKLERRNKAIALQKEEISKQNEKLGQLVHIKNQIFSIVSHDLRSPFASVLQTMELARGGELDDAEQAEIMEASYQQLSHLAVMVNNLLVWANSQQAGLNTEIIEVDITQAVQDTLLVAGDIANNKKISIIHDFTGPQPALADADQLKIMIQNVIGNALKFTPEGGTINIDYSSDNTYRAIHIRDSGTGISPEKMAKLFKVVGKQISGYGTNKEIGAGIGLLLVKQFADANNGKLKIHSDYGEGSTVSVYLPLAGVVSCEW